MIEEKVRNIFTRTGTGKDFLNRALITQILRKNFNKKISLKKLLYSKGHQYLIEEAAYRLGKIFTSYTSGKVLVSRMYKEINKKPKYQENK